MLGENDEEQDSNVCSVEHVILTHLDRGMERVEGCGEFGMMLGFCGIS